MAQTAFINPLTVTQAAGTDTVAWNLQGATPQAQDGNRCGSTEPLRAINLLANLTGQRTTHTLLFGGFDLSAVSGTVQGIAVRVFASKQSRCRDHLVQLYHNGALVGANRATAAAGDEHTYGSSADLWGTQLTANQLQTISVALAYESGVMPHQDHMYVDTVQLQVNYTP